jgi:hypothetical protein
MRTDRENHLLVTERFWGMVGWEDAEDMNPMASAS